MFSDRQALEPQSFHLPLPALLLSLAHSVACCPDAPEPSLSPALLSWCLSAQTLSFFRAIPGQGLIPCTLVGKHCSCPLEYVSLLEQMPPPGACLQALNHVQAQGRPSSTGLEP